MTQSPIQGVSFAHAFADAKARDPPPHAVLRDDGPPLHLSRRLAGGVPGARAVVRRGGHGLRRDGRSPRTSCASSTRRAGSFTTSTTTSRRPRTWPHEHRDKLIEMIALWYVEAGKYDVLPIDAAARRASSTSGRSSRRRATCTSTTRARRWSRTRSPRASLNRPHSITATVEIDERRRGRAGRAGRLVGRLRALRQGSQAALRLQLPRRAAVPPRDRHDGRRRAARAALRVRADRQARPRRTARGRRRARSSTSTASWPARATCRSPSRSTSASPRGSRAGATTARRSRPTTGRRSPSRASSRRSSSTSRASSSRTRAPRCAS